MSNTRPLYTEFQSVLSTEDCIYSVNMIEYTDEDKCVENAQDRRNGTTVCYHATSQQELILI